MEEIWLARTEMLIGKDAIEKLKQSKVLVLGLGRSWLVCCNGACARRNRKHHNNR